MAAEAGTRSPTIRAPRSPTSSWTVTTHARFTGRDSSLSAFSNPIKTAQATRLSIALPASRFAPRSRTSLTSVTGDPIRTPSDLASSGPDAPTSM
jgi:hypothetical protein